MDTHYPSRPDAATIAIILDRLSATERAAIREQRAQLNMSPLVQFDLMLRWGQQLDGPVGAAWHRAYELLHELGVETGEDQVEAELDRLDAVKAPMASEIIELPQLRHRRGPKGHDDRRHLMHMRELIRTRKGVDSASAAAKCIVGPDDPTGIERLRGKYLEWQEDGFPTEWVAAD